MPEGRFRLFSLTINCEPVMFWLELAAAFIIEARTHMSQPLCCEHVLVILAVFDCELNIFLGVLSPSYLHGSCDNNYHHFFFFLEQMPISQACFRVRVIISMKTDFTAALI